MYMDSVGNPTTFAPYINTEDCSQGFCSLNCPQWCYIIFPPPPPLEFPVDRDSPSSFSPLWITIVGILASAFILVSYYAIISKYCRNSSPTSQENQHSNHESDWNTSLHEAWQTMNSGLEEGLIKSISVCRYKKGGKSIEGTECSVCLNEFQDGEDLRVLPKCPHAFHVNCIDTWLRSHSNCPLCRSNIALLSPPTDDPVTIEEQNSANETEENGRRDAQVAEGDEAERDVVIEIHEEEQRGIRRSVSMDASSTVRSICVADILEIDDDEEEEEVGEVKHEKDGKQQKDDVHGRMKRSHSSGVLRLRC